MSTLVMSVARPKVERIVGVTATSDTTDVAPVK
jgi:hypothetical protein